MSASEHCDICPFLTNPSEEELSRRIIEGKYWVATLRDDQEYLGTAYVTLRDHKSSLEELTPAEDHEFTTLRNRLIVAQKQAFNATVINVSCLMNDAFRTRIPAPHVHYHFKPRYDEPVAFGGNTFIDRQFGHYIRDKYPHPVSADMSKQIIAALKMYL